MFDTCIARYAKVGAMLLAVVTVAPAYACTDDPTCGGLFTTPNEMPDYRENLFTSAAIAKMEEGQDVFSSAAIAKMEKGPGSHGTLFTGDAFAPRDSAIRLDAVPPPTTQLPVFTLNPPPPPNTFVPAPSPHPTPAPAPAAPLPGYQVVAVVVASLAAAAGLLRLR